MSRLFRVFLAGTFVVAVVTTLGKRGLLLRLLTAQRTHPLAWARTEDQQYEKPTQHDELHFVTVFPGDRYRLEPQQYPANWLFKLRSKQFS